MSLFLKLVAIILLAVTIFILPLVALFWLPSIYRGFEPLAIDLRLYLVGLRPTLNFFQMFTGQELAHLADVKSLLAVAQLYLGVIGGGLVVGLVQWRPITLQLLHRAGWVAGIVSVILLLLGLVASDQLLIWLHQLLFTNNYWVLDPAQHLLIRLYPPDYWSVMLGWWLALSFVLSIGVVIIKRRVTSRDV